MVYLFVFFFQAEDGIRDRTVTGVQTCALPILRGALSNGFRAPSLHQVWFNNVSTQFVTVAGALEPQQVLTSNNLSRVTEAFGRSEERRVGKECRCRGGA